MRGSVYILLVLIMTLGCQVAEKKYVEKVDWSAHLAGEVTLDSLANGSVYLPVYSHIYHIKESRKYDLTVTVSFRNTSVSDTLYLTRVDYYNTEGTKIRSYVDNPVFLNPMATLEIVIEDADIEGGSGANFIIDWAMPTGQPSPLFEAVMISSEGQQGISFTTRGVPID